MSFWKMSHQVTITLVALAFLGGIGCGKKDNPAPPPPPQNPNPTQGGPIGFSGGNCGGVQGQPLTGVNGPLSAQLIGQSGTGGSSSITLNIALATNVSYYSVQNVVGNAQMVLPELQTYFGAQQTTLCAQSNDPQTGAIYQGTYDFGSKAVTMTLAGVIAIPVYSPYISPYGGYPGGAPVQGTPTPVLVEIGVACPALIVEGRLEGCVDVTVGTPGYSQPLYYDARSYGGYGGGYGGGYVPYY